MFKIKWYFGLTLIILLGIFLRFYQLSAYPIQLNHDEITQLYDAISIAQTARDIYGNYLPTIFYSVHDFKPPFYTYITSLFYLIFGGSELTIRLPGAVFGVLIIPAVFFLTLKLFRSKGAAFYSALFTAIAPFELFFSRKSFENGAGIFFMVLGFVFMFSYLDKSRKGYLVAGLISFALGMYTYFSHVFIIPLLLATFVIIYRNHFQQVKSYFSPIVIFLVLLIPLALIILTNPDSSFRTKTVFITQDTVLGEQLSWVGYGGSALGQLMQVKVIIDYGISRYLNQLDFNYIFGNGLSLTRQGPLDSGLLLFMQMPFVLIGGISLLKNKRLKLEKIFILSWLAWGILPSAITFEERSPHRSVMVFTMLNIISALGLYLFIRWLKDLKVWQKGLAYGLLVGFFVINFAYFAHLYIYNFPSERSQDIQYPFKQVTQFAWSRYPDYKQIIFDPQFGEIAPMIGTGAHYYFGYYGNYPPAQFQRSYATGPGERELRFDKFSIRKVNWVKDSSLNNTLIIASDWSLPIDKISDKKIIKTFNFYNGKPAFYAVDLQ